MNNYTFRGKRLDNGEWVYGYYFQLPLTSENGIGSIGNGKIQNVISDSDGVVYRIDKETIGQYTGLKDVNGIKIFEGDVVRENDSKIGYIKFLLQEMGYVIVYKKYDTRLGHRNTRSGYNYDLNLEIIGNITDNPELLENEV